LPSGVDGTFPLRACLSNRTNDGHPSVEKVKASSPGDE